jgi:type IV pilus secretin PilQ/predicted competence protein
VPAAQNGGSNPNEIRPVSYQAPVPAATGLAQTATPATGSGRAPPPPPPEVVPVPQGVPGLPAEALPGSRAKPGGSALITLHADNLDVRKALEIVSRQAKVNILVTPGVSGDVTLDVRDKTVDETLQAIVKLCHLTVQRDKDVFYVTTLADLRQGEEDDLPIRVYHLNYVTSNDVDAMIKPLLSSKGTTSKSPKSEVGLTSDVVASTGGSSGGGGTSSAAVKAGGDSMAGGEILIVQDYEQVLKTIDKAIAEIDIQPVQVLIEAVILQVTLDKTMDLGVNVGVLDGAGRALGVVGNGALINAAAGFTPASVLTAGGAVANGAASGFAENVNGVKFGWVGGNTTGFIRALESFSETKVLASPRILVLNKQRAEIHLGDQLGYETSTVSQTSTTQTVQFLNIGTQLRLRPFVSSDGWIRMEVHPERSTGKIDSNGIPQTNTSQVTSNVMIPDGATIVIGGLMDTEVNKDWEGIPFLSRIPLLGYLFRHTIDDTPKKELVVLLTPHIWKPQCPDALNYLGRPRCLGLESRVAQVPHEEQRDGPSLLEITPPPARVPATGPGPVPALVTPPPSAP